MTSNSKIVDLRADDMEALARLTWTREAEERRQRRVRRERRLLMVEMGFCGLILLACGFCAGILVGVL